jgi:hypothetical protein
MQLISLSHDQPVIDSHLSSCALDLLSRSTPSLARAVASNDFVAHALQVRDAAKFASFALFYAAVLSRY